MRIVWFMRLTLMTRLILSWYLSSLKISFGFKHILAQARHPIIIWRAARILRTVGLSQTDRLIFYLITYRRRIILYPFADCAITLTLIFILLEKFAALAGSPPDRFTTFTFTPGPSTSWPFTPYAEMSHTITSVMRLSLYWFFGIIVIIYHAHGWLMQIVTASWRIIY